MPRNGTGGYSLPINSWNPAINGVAATSSDWQQVADDIQTAIQQSVSSDGQTTMTGSLQMGGFVVAGLGAPSGVGQSLRWEQLQKGSDIASAPTINIPNEGALFAVTGTTGISAFSGSFPGRTIYLRFVSAVVLNNNAFLVLPNGQNIGTWNGLVLGFVCDDAGVWRCIGGPQPAAGLTGTARGLRANISAPTQIATFTADELIAKDVLGGSAFTLSFYNQAINLGTIGAGGMDTGLAPANGYVGIYAIYNPSGNVRSILATDATASFMYGSYVGSNMPAGYSASSLLSVWPTDASRQLVVGAQRERKIAITPVQVLSTNVPVGTSTPLSITGAVPINAVSCVGNSSMSSTLTSSMSSLFSSDGAGSGSVTTSNAGAGQVLLQTFETIITTGQTVFRINTSSAGAFTHTVNIVSYEI